MDKISSNLLKLASNVSKYCVGMEGNISGLDEDGSILIKASGSNLSKLTENDLIPFDIDGNQTGKMDKRGSIELSFHLFLLGFEDINYISHTHPISSLKILCGNQITKHLFSTRRLFPDQVIFNGKESCLVPYSKPGEELTDKIKEKVNGFINKNGYFPKLILLENHGIISCGKTIEECIIINDICEKSADIFNGNEINNLTFLTIENINELIIDKGEEYRQSLVK